MPDRFKTVERSYCKRAGKQDRQWNHLPERPGLVKEEPRRYKPDHGAGWDPPQEIQRAPPSGVSDII
jgi:hypothetical protein